MSIFDKQQTDRLFPYHSQRNQRNQIMLTCNHDFKNSQKEFLIKIFKTNVFFFTSIFYEKNKSNLFENEVQIID